jgi:hypothetical protein
MSCVLSWVSRALFVCVLCASPALYADDFERLPESQQKLWADTLVTADNQLKQGDLSGAARTFERAKAIYPDPRIAKKLADVYSKLAQWDQAEDNLKAYAESLPAGDERERIEGQLRAIQAKQAELEVVTSPEAVEVRVYRAQEADPVIRRSTPMEALVLQPGSYRVTFAREGFMGREERVTLKRGERATLRVSLSQVPVEESGAPLATKILGATGIAALAVGLGFVGYGANQYYGAAPSGENGLSRAAANERKTDGKRNMAIGGITAGAGALLGGIGLLYWNLSDDEPASAHIQTGPGDIDVSVELRF